MDAIERQARIAGFLYLLVVFIGPFRLIYIPNTLFVAGNATATADNIAAHVLLFRWGLVSEVIGATIMLCVVLALYRLFKRVDENLAALMVIAGGLMVTPLAFANIVTDAAALLIARGANFLSVFDKPQRDALVLLFVQLHHAGDVAQELFWGLWLLPFGLLVYRSGFIPRLLGVWLVLNCFAYVALCLTAMLAPQYESAVFNYGTPVFFGEVAIMLWLVIVGARARPREVISAAHGV